MTNDSLPDLTLVRRRIVVTVNEPNVQLTQVEVLRALYDATDGANWKNTWDWSDTTNIKNWYGLTVENDIVVAINLNNNNLVGTIPHSINALFSLQRLDLSNNAIKGEIPTTLGNLSVLTELDLSNNQFTGTIPTSLGNLTSLEKLYLQGNQFTQNQPFPTALSNLVKLRELNLSDVGIVGDIPTSFLGLTALTRLFLNNNRLDTLPNLSNLNNLAVLEVQDNYLTFKYLEPNRFVSDFDYAPQKAQDTIRMTREEGDNFELALSDDVLQASNQYDWRQGSRQLNINAPVISFPNAVPDNGGIYNCLITNNLLHGLMLSYHFEVVVIPDNPKISAPKTYCMSDTSATLISNGENADKTICYADPDLTEELGKGEKLQVDVETQRTIYAVIFDADNQSEVVSKLIARRPILENEGTKLMASGHTLADNLIYQWYKNGVRIVEANGAEYETNGEAGCSSHLKVVLLLQ